jgi:hypothetical protein
MTQTSVHVFLTPEIGTLLADNGIDLVRELRKQGLQVEKSFGADPTAAGEDRGKDVSLIILASSTAVVALSAGISKIIDALGRNRKVVAKDIVCEPILGGDGQPLKHLDGSPMLQWVEHTKILEAQQTTQDATKLSASLTPTEGIKFEMQSGAK